MAEAEEQRRTRHDVPEPEESFADFGARREGTKVDPEHDVRQTLRPCDGDVDVYAPVAPSSEKRMLCRVLRGWMAEGDCKRLEDALVRYAAGSSGTMRKTVTSNSSSEPDINGGTTAIAGHFDRRTVGSSVVLKKTSNRLKPVQMGNVICRTTHFTRNHMRKWKHEIVPILEKVGQVHALLDPERYAAQKDYVKQGVLPMYHIGDTAYTTLSANYNFQTHIHVDKGDLDEGSGVMVVAGRDYCGGAFCFPRYKLAVELQPRDLIVMNVHEWHGNLPIVVPPETPDGFRLSMILYARKDMAKCNKVIDATETISVPWSATSHDERFDATLLVLHAFVKDHKGRHPNVDERYMATNLGEWCHRQRMLHRQGKLNDHRATVLEAVRGWKWDVPVEAEGPSAAANRGRSQDALTLFRRCLQLTEDYCAAHGHLPRGSKESIQGLKLGKWIDNRRQDLRRYDLGGAGGSGSGSGSGAASGLLSRLTPAELARLRALLLGHQISAPVPDTAMPAAMPTAMTTPSITEDTMTAMPVPGGRPSSGRGDPNSDYVIAIASYRRADVCKEGVLRLLIRHGIDPMRVTIFVANETERRIYAAAFAAPARTKRRKKKSAAISQDDDDDERKGYCYAAFAARLHVIVTRTADAAASASDEAEEESKGILRVRQYIQQHYAQGQFVISMDDDIEDIYELKPGAKHVEARRRMGRSANRRVPIQSLHNLIREGFRVCKANGARLWGVFRSQPPCFLRDCVHVGLCFVPGTFWGCINSHADERRTTLEDLDDFERSLQYFALDGRICRLNYVNVKVLHNCVGGMQGVRTLEVTRQCMVDLARRYPDNCQMIAPTPKRRPGRRKVAATHPPTAAADATDAATIADATDAASAADATDAATIADATDAASAADATDASIAADATDADEQPKDDPSVPALKIRTREVLFSSMRNVAEIL